MNTFKDDETNCPTMVCNIINQFINDKQIDIKGLKQSTYCNIDKTGDTPSPSPTQNPIQDIFSTKYKVGIIISILLTLIFIFLTFFFVANSISKTISLESKPIHS